MATKKRGRPKKSVADKQRHYVGIRYDDRTQAFLEEYQRLHPRVPEAEVWRRGLDLLREREGL